MNNNRSIFLILIAICSTMAIGSSNYNKNNQNQYPEPSAPSPAEFDFDDPYKDASAPSIEECNGPSQPTISYPKVQQERQNTEQDIQRKLGFLSVQQMEEYTSLSPDEKQALSVCSIEEIKQTLNARLAQKNKGTRNNKRQSSDEYDPREIAQVKQNSVDSYNAEELARGIEQSKQSEGFLYRLWRALID